MINSCYDADYTSHGSNLEGKKWKREVKAILLVMQAIFITYTAGRQKDIVDSYNDIGNTIHSNNSEKKKSLGNT